MQVKVWNDNVYPFTQELAGKVYRIPAKEYLEMDEEEADKLVKAFSPIRVNYDGAAEAASYKMLRVDQNDLKNIKDKRENKAKSGSYVCQACGYIASNKWELNGHIIDLHKDSFEDRDEALESISKEQAEKKRKRG